MEDIQLVYRNSFGLAFYWKNRDEKVQVVFRNTGFYLNLEELKEFRQLVIQSLQEACCNNCTQNKRCRSLLLKTPSEKIDLAVNREELAQIKELLNGAIFKVEQSEFLKFSAN